MQNSLPSEYLQTSRAGDSSDSITNFLGFSKPFSRAGDISSNEACNNSINSDNSLDVKKVETYSNNGLNGVGKDGGDYLGNRNPYYSGRAGNEQSTGLPSFFQEFPGEPKGSQDSNFGEMGRRLFQEDDAFGNTGSFGSQGTPWNFHQEFSKGKEEYGRYGPSRKSMGEEKLSEGPTHLLYKEGEELNQGFRKGPFQVRMGPDSYYEGGFGNNERHSFYEGRAVPLGPGEISRIHGSEGPRNHLHSGAFSSPHTLGDREFGHSQASFGSGQKMHRQVDGADYDRRMMASLFPNPAFRTHFQQRYTDVPVQNNAWMNRKKRKSNPLLWQYIKSNQGLHPGIVHPSKYSSLDFIQGVDDSQKMYLGTMRKSSPERSNGNSIFPLFLNSNKGVTDEFKEVVQNFKDSVSELDFNNVTVQQLKSLMKEFGLNHTGKKNELIERLQDILKKIDGKEAHKPEEHVQEKTKEIDDFEFYFF